MTDCIQYGIKMFTLHEKRNLEMKNNSQKLSRLSLGEMITEKSLLIRQIENYCNDKKKLISHFENCKSINLQGPLQVSNYIREIFENNKKTKS